MRGYQHCGAIPSVIQTDGARLGLDSEAGGLAASSEGTEGGLGRRGGGACGGTDRTWRESSWPGLQPALDIGTFGYLTQTPVAAPDLSLTKPPSTETPEPFPEPETLPAIAIDDESDGFSSLHCLWNHDRRQERTGMGGDGVAIGAVLATGGVEQSDNSGSVATTQKLKLISSRCRPGTQTPTSNP